MAKSALTGGELTVIRSNQSIPDLSLFVTPLQEVVTGTVTNVPTRYPSTQLTMSWGGATTDVSIGQMIRITNGDTIKAYTVVRKAVAGNTLYLGETPLGAYGYATMIEQPILVGDTVTIYNHRPLWAMYSRIDAKTKTFYKLWDVPYTSENEGSIIVANAGAWQAAKLSTGETTARFTLPRGGVNSSFNISGGTPPSTIDWTLPAGVSLVTGYALDDFVIEVDAVAGSHLISMVAAVGGRSHTAYLWLFVSDGTNHLSATNAVSLPQSDSQSRLGREMSFTVYGDNLQDTIYPGAGFLLREWPHYDSGELSEGVGIDSFVGYIVDINFSHDGNIGSATFKVESPMVYAQRIAQPPQSLEEVTEAVNWVQCESVLSNPCGFAYYLIRWHTPALLEMHDFDAADYLSPRRKYLQCNNRNLGANLQVVADYIAGNVGSASDGTTVLRANPLYQGQSARDAVATILTFQEQDIAAPLNYARRMVAQYAEARGGAFWWGGTGKPKAAYVGRRWGQGSGSIDMPEFTVTAAEGLTEAKAKIGHFFAEQNAEIQSIDLDLTLNMDVLDPAYMTWAALTLDSDYDPYGIGFSSNRLLANTIEREWSLENGNILKRIKVRSQGETFGQAGEELPIGANANQNGWSVGAPIIWQPNFSGGMFGGDQALPVVLVNNNGGQFAICLNYMIPNPEWFDLRSSVNNEAVNDWDFDYGSAYFASGRDASQALGVYAVTTSEDEAHIWYFADVLRTPIAEQIKSLTLDDETIVTEARILCSESYPLLVLAGFKDGTGTRYSRSTDGGASFGSLTRVGNAVVDRVDNDNAPLGMAVDGQRQLISAPNADIEYGTYYASTAAGSFSKLSSSQDSAYPQQMIAIAPDSTTAYVSSVDMIAASNDFDGSDYWAYNATPVFGGVDEWTEEVESADWTYNGIDTGGGLAGDAPKWTGTNPQGEGGGVDRAGMTFIPTDYPSDVTFYGISGRIKFTLSAGTQQLSLAVSGGSLLERFIAQGQWHTFNFNFTNDSVFPLTANNLILRFSPRHDVTGTMTVWIDDITVYLGEGGKLWKVTNFTGSPSWSNISPSANEAPNRPYDFTVDRLDNSNLHFVSESETDWMKSTNTGSSFVAFENNTPFRALYVQGNNLAAAGLETIGISLTGTDEFYDLSGNLDSLWDGILSIKKILAL
jgi:hypothetical protein